MSPWLTVSVVGRMPAGRSAIRQPTEMAEPPIGVPPYAGYGYKKLHDTLSITHQSVSTVGAQGFLLEQ